MSILLNFNITSPDFTPALKAGPSSVAEDTKAPFGDSIPKLSAISLEICCIKTPNHPRFVRP